MGVEQVRRAVQRRDRLAGARAALHHQDTLQGGADDPVLFGLDGGHDVAHPAGAAGGDAGDQHGLAGQALPVRLGQPVQVEDLVVDSGDGAVPGVDVAAPDQPGRVLGGGGVEGVGGGRAPVDEPRLVLVVSQADPADVQGAPVRRFRFRFSEVFGFVGVSGSASVRPKHRPCSTAFSWASRRACSAAVTSRSTRAWKVPPAAPPPCVRASARSVRSRASSSSR